MNTRKSNDKFVHTEIEDKLINKHTDESTRKRFLILQNYRAPIAVQECIMLTKIIPTILYLDIIFFMHIINN